MNEIIAFIILIVVFFAALILLIKNFIKIQKERFAKKQEYTVLAVQVAKENEVGPIVAEQIFATLHSITTKLTFWKKLKGATEEKVSFEIANCNRTIKFYIWLPKRLKNLVEGQIYAQYPDVEILEVEDYAKKEPVEISKKDTEKTISHQTSITTKTEIEQITKQKKFEKYEQTKNAIGAELKLDSPEIYPIKRYPQFEDKLTRLSVDPIAGITAPLAKLNHPNEEAWIQIIISPLEKKWKNIFVNCLKILNRGVFLKIESLQMIYANVYITRNKFLRKLFFPLYTLLWIQGIKAGLNKKTVITADNKVSKENAEELIEEMSKSHERETDISAALDKVVKILFKTTIRLVYLPQTGDQEIKKLKINEMTGSFNQFNIPHLNGFEIKNIIHGKDIVQKYQNREMDKDNFVLNTEELATIYHLPSKTVSTPNIYWIRSRKLEPPTDLPSPENSYEEGLTILGKTNFRGMHEPFGIKTSDRRRHFYIIGKTGMGKSTLLENMLYSDIQSGKGVAVVDPHGDLADAVLSFVPARRTNEVVIFDPSDRNFPVAFNMLENINPEHNSVICSGLVGIFKKIYADSWGPRLEHFLRNTILALLEYPDTTMLGITRMLQDQQFRQRVVRKISDPIVKAFWTQEFEKMQDRQRIEAISPILNKVGQFLSSPIIRNIVGQPKSAIDLRFAMDKGKIVIVNLSKGKIGEDNSSLLGSMIITKFQLDAMSRADTPEKDRKDFYLYVDEFQNFATDSFATILSEARKYKLNLTMANQYIAQMAEEVRDAVFGNVGSILAFQVGPTDAEFLSTQFGEEEVTINDLVSLSKYTSYLKLLVDGMPTPSFSMDTMAPPVIETEEGRREKVIQVARERYSKPRDMVEDKIRRWSLGAEDLTDEKDQKKLSGTDKKFLNKPENSENIIEKKVENPKKIQPNSTSAKIENPNTFKTPISQPELKEKQTLQPEKTVYNEPKIETPRKKKKKKIKKTSTESQLPLF